MLLFSSSLLTITLRAVAWGLTGACAYTVYQSIRQTVKTATRMHQIPCSRCRYFTEDYNLKCPVHPHHALSEAAIGCRDFEVDDR